MADVNDPRATAWAAVHNPETSGSRLAEIAQAHPEFAGAIAAHAQAYPELVNWAQQAQQAVALANAPAPLPPSSDEAPLLTPEPPSSSRPSGWAIVGKAADGVEAVVDGAANVLTKLYGLGLLVAGVVAIFLIPAVWWGGLLFAAYGLYLLLPGNKWVIW